MMYRFRVDRIVKASSWAEAKAKYFESLCLATNSPYDTATKADESLVNNHTIDMGNYRMVSHASVWSDLRNILDKMEL